MLYRAVANHSYNARRNQGTLCDRPWKRCCLCRRSSLTARWMFVVASCDEGVCSRFAFDHCRCHTRRARLAFRNCEFCWQPHHILDTRDTSIAWKPVAWHPTAVSQVLVENTCSLHSRAEQVRVHQELFWRFGRLCDDRLTRLVKAKLFFEHSAWQGSSQAREQSVVAKVCRPGQSFHDRGCVARCCGLRWGAQRLPQLRAPRGAPQLRACPPLLRDEEEPHLHVLSRCTPP